VSAAIGSTATPSLPAAQGIRDEALLDGHHLRRRPAPLACRHRRDDTVRAPDHVLVTDGAHHRQHLRRSQKRHGTAERYGHRQAAAGVGSDTLHGVAVPKCRGVLGQPGGHPPEHLPIGRGLNVLHVVQYIGQVTDVELGSIHLIAPAGAELSGGDVLELGGAGLAGPDVQSLL
jgi:hypothetical protein